MKAVILAGGLGTRLSEETVVKPKPMVEIGESPILWHIMKLYSYYGVNEFIICLGYKGYMIKEYFANYFLHFSDVTFDLQKNSVEIHDNYCEPWKVTLVETGDHTMTGGRLKRVKKYVENETFFFTYGDGVCNVNISNLLKFHKKMEKLATVTAVNPPGRFGALELQSDSVKSFSEKTTGEHGWINGGFFVLESPVFDYIDGDDTIWEIDPISRLIGQNMLAAYRHDGFWQPMDTLREKTKLQEMWESGHAPWKVW